MAEPKFVQQAKAKAQTEFQKSTAGVRGYAETFLTSRISLALATAFFIAFTTSAVYFPGQLPPIANVGLVNAGILSKPPTLDLSDFNVSEGDIRAKTDEAVSEAKPYVQRTYDNAVASIPNFPLYVNIGGALLSFAMFLYTLKIQIRAARNPTKSVAL